VHLSFFVLILLCFFFFYIYLFILYTFFPSITRNQSYCFFFFSLQPFAEPGQKINEKGEKEREKKIVSIDEKALYTYIHM
jgi:hypothetical protein